MGLEQFVKGFEGKPVPSVAARPISWFSVPRTFLRIQRCSFDAITVAMQEAWTRTFKKSCGCNAISIRHRTTHHDTQEDHQPMTQQSRTCLDRVSSLRDSDQSATSQCNRTLSGQPKSFFHRFFGWMNRPQKEETWLRQNMPYVDGP